MECHYCGAKKEGLPFRCNYCGENFCGEHRLPENHECPRVRGPKQPSYARPTRTDPYLREKMNLPYISTSRSRFGISYSGIFSKTEIKHVIAATAVVALVGLTIGVGFWNFYNPLDLFMLLAGFALSFLGHELAHKFLARRYGLWAEFRTNLFGLMLTAVSAIFPTFKFLAPGQTNVRGNAGKDAMGAVHLVGPGLNIGLGALFLATSRLFLGAGSNALLTELALFNGWLAVINLIPFGSLDGSMVFNWDKTRWLIALAASVTIVSVSSYYFYVI